MKIVRIFASNNCLLSALYDYEDQDEFYRLLDQWTDVEYLFNYFTMNQFDLLRYHLGSVSIESAVLATMRDAKAILRKLRQLNGLTSDLVIENLSAWFRPLNPLAGRVDLLDKRKLYGQAFPGWLRLYAIRVDASMYLITGGAIKLTARMEDRLHTKRELDKLVQVRSFLLDYGLVDQDGILEYMESDFHESNY